MKYVIFVSVVIVFGFLHPVNHVRSPHDRSHIQSLSMLARYKSHQSTNTKLAHGSGRNTASGKHNQVKNSQNDQISIITFHLSTTDKSIFKQVICTDLPGVRQCMKSQENKSDSVLWYTITHVSETVYIPRALNMGSCINGL